MYTFAIVNVHFGIRFNDCKVVPVLSAGNRQSELQGNLQRGAEVLPRHNLVNPSFCARFYIVKSMKIIDKF